MYVTYTTLDRVAVCDTFFIVLSGSIEREPLNNHSFSHFKLKKENKKRRQVATRA